MEYSGDALQPLYVCGEAALCWQSRARAAATPDSTTGVFPTLDAPEVSGVRSFLLGLQIQPAPSVSEQAPCWESQ